MDVETGLNWLLKNRDLLPDILDTYLNETGLSMSALGRKMNVSEFSVRSWANRRNPRFPRSENILRSIVTILLPIIERQALLTRDPKPQTPDPSPDMAAAIARTTQACLEAGRPINRDEAELLCSVGIHFHTYGHEPLTPQIIDALLLMIRGDQIQKEHDKRHETPSPNNRGTGQ